MALLPKPATEDDETLLVLLDKQFAEFDEKMKLKDATGSSGSALSEIHTPRVKSTTSTYDHEATVSFIKRTLDHSNELLLELECREADEIVPYGPDLAFTAWAKAQMDDAVRSLPPARQAAVYQEMASGNNFDIVGVAVPSSHPLFSSSTTGTHQQPRRFVSSTPTSASIMQYSVPSVQPATAEPATFPHELSPINADSDSVVPSHAGNAVRPAKCPATTVSSSFNMGASMPDLSGGDCGMSSNAPHGFGGSQPSGLASSSRFDNISPPASTHPLHGGIGDSAARQKAADMHGRRSTFTKVPVEATLLAQEFENTLTTEDHAPAHAVAPPPKPRPASCRLTHVIPPATSASNNNEDEEGVLDRTIAILPKESDAADSTGLINQSYSLALALNGSTKKSQHDDDDAASMQSEASSQSSTTNLSNWSNRNIAAGHATSSNIRRSGVAHPHIVKRGGGGGGGGIRPPLIKASVNNFAAMPNSISSTPSINSNYSSRTNSLDNVNNPRSPIGDTMLTGGGSRAASGVRISATSEQAAPLLNAGRRTSNIAPPPSSSNLRPPAASAGGLRPPGMLKRI